MLCFSPKLGLKLLFLYCFSLTFQVKINDHVSTNLVSVYMLMRDASLKQFKHSMYNMHLNF